MRILLDENLPRKLVGYLVEHDCRTVAECGWSGRKNGELLLLADPLFDVLLTLDKNLPAESGYKTNCRSDHSGPGRTGFRTSFRSFQSASQCSRRSSLARSSALVHCRRVSRHQHRFEPINSMNSTVVKLAIQLSPCYFTFCFHDNEEVGPAALAKIAKDTGLRPEDL